jgi:hypothetical protein
MGGASFIVTGEFPNAVTSSLKRVTGRIFKNSKCFQRSKPRLCVFHFLHNKAAKNLKSIGAYAESTVLND